MLPAFLRYLRDNDYRVVHVVPAGLQSTASDKMPIEPADRLEYQTIKAPFMCASVMIECQVTLPRSGNFVRRNVAMTSSD